MQVLPGIVSTPGSTVTDATGQDAVTSTAALCTRPDRASMKRAMSLRLRPFCMRFGMPFVVQVTSTMTPCSFGMKPTTMRSP